MLLFYLPFILFTFSMFAEAYHHPHKLPQNYDYKIVVEDKANVLGNTAELRTRWWHFITAPVSHLRS